MSLDAAVSSLISVLKGISSSTRGQAVNLIAQADAALTGIAPPALTPVEFDVERTTTASLRIPAPPQVDEVAAFEPPAFSGLQEVTSTTATFGITGAGITVPQITLPGAVTTTLPEIPSFTESIPNVTPFSIAPDFSLADRGPEKPALTRPQALRVNPLSGDPPAVPLPQFDTFEGDFFDEYETGLGIIAPEVAEFSEWLRQLYQEVILRWDSIFTTRMRGILHGTETAVPADWATQRHTQTVQDLRNERQGALTALDDAPSSQTGLPTGQRLWARLDLELKTAQATVKSASKVALERREREAKHWQWAMQLCAQWVEAALDLKAQEVGWRMKGAQLALEGATQALALASKVLETKSKEIGFFIQYNETQSRRTDLRLKLEQTKLTELKSVLASNQLKSSFNQHQLQVHQGAITLIEQRAKKYQTELEYFALQQQLEKLKLRVYETQIKGFEANINAFAAEHQALAARIKGDVARSEGELLKVRQYQAKIKAFEAEVAELSTTITAQSAQNKALLDEYNALLEGALTELRAFDMVTRIAIAALVQGYDAEAAEVSLKLQQQDMEDRAALDNAWRDMQRDHTDATVKLEEYGVRFAQRQAMGAVITQGAGTVGGMATQAFAGLNWLAAMEIIEGA